MDEGKYSIVMAQDVQVTAFTEVAYSSHVIQPANQSHSYIPVTNKNGSYFSDLIEVPGIRYTLVILHVLITILAGLGNGSLIYFILKNRKLRTNVTAYLVLNLAICDLITTCIHQPMRLADILMPFAYKDVDSVMKITKTYCQIKEFMAALFAGVAFHTIVAISQERHLLVCYPLKARGWLTVSRIKSLLATIWIVSFVALLPAYAWYTFIANIPLRDANVTFCMIDIVNNHGNTGISYFLFLFCLYFIIPTFAISLTYGRIFYVLSRGLGVAEIKDLRFAKVMAARKRLAKLMLGIAIVFIVLHAPFFVTYLLVSQGYGIPDNPVFVLLIIEFMGSLNSVFNPFIYSANSKTLFKKRMVNFLGGQDTDTGSQTGTPRHEAGVRTEHGIAGREGTSTTVSTPSRHFSTPTRQVPQEQQHLTPAKHYQTIVTLTPTVKEGVEV